MIPISAAGSGGVVWSRNGSKYELKLKDNVIGRLHKTSFWSSDYCAETYDGNWTFLRRGILGNGAEIRGEKNLCAAKFKPGWGEPGTLTFADGQTFLVWSEGCWRPVWKVTTVEGRQVLQVPSREKTVWLEDQRNEPENQLGQKPANGLRLPPSRWLLLVLFILYRMQQAEEDGAVAAMVAAVG